VLFCPTPNSGSLGQSQQSNAGATTVFAMIDTIMAAFATASLIPYVTLGLGIVMGGANPLGFGRGRGRVGVRVEIFHPENDLDPDTGSCRSQARACGWERR